MKLKLSIITVLISLVVLVASVLQEPASVEGYSFQSRLREVFDQNGYRLVETSVCRPGDVPLPFTLRWHRRFWGPERPRFMTGFPDRGERYAVTYHDSSMIDCFVRYLDDRACFVDLHASKASKEAIEQLRSKLVQEFSGVAIRVTYGKDNGPLP